VVCERHITGGFMAAIATAKSRKREGSEEAVGRPYWLMARLK
jgi:hypothetical protein